MELDKDHIHLLMEFNPCYSISQVVRRLKQLTTWYIWRDNEQWLKKFYWSGKRVLWTGGYFCSTIGEVSEKIIVHYIESQG
jgi:putative transposase